MSKESDFDIASASQSWQSKPSWNEEVRQPPEDLKECLRLYGHHLGDCPVAYWDAMARIPKGAMIMHVYPLPPHTCTCGFSEACR